MRIHNINFTARVSSAIKKQFSNGVKRYEQKPEMLALYEQHVKAIKQAETDCVIVSTTRVKSPDGKPVIAYARNDEIFSVAKQPSLEGPYNASIKEEELSTINGVFALRQDVENISSNQ